MTSFVNELAVKTVGPALVFVVELEAPLRFATLASTPQEFERLREWSLFDPTAREITQTFLRLEGELGEHERADAHSERLSFAIPLPLGERVG